LVARRESALGSIFNPDSRGETTYTHSAGSRLMTYDPLEVFYCYYDTLSVDDTLDLMDKDEMNPERMEDTHG
jgi:hypothetical protein